MNKVQLGNPKLNLDSFKIIKPPSPTKCSSFTSNTETVDFVALTPPSSSESTTYSSMNTASTSSSNKGRCVSEETMKWLEQRRRFLNNRNKKHYKRMFPRAAHISYARPQQSNTDKNENNGDLEYVD